MRHQLLLLIVVTLLSNNVLAGGVLDALAEHAAKEVITSAVPDAGKHVDDVKALVEKVKKSPETVAAGKQALKNLKTTVDNTPDSVKTQIKQKAAKKVLELLNKPE